VTGAATGSADIDNWYNAAVQGDTSSARKSFTLTVSDASVTVLRRFFVEHGRPTALLNQGDRYQLTLSAEFVQKVAA
jgi:hypothetical protein